jgi:peptide/nickel transport system permease protein
MLVVIFAPILAPFDMARQDIPNRLDGPSAVHWLGTDHLGRDILSRLIYGSRIAIGTALPAVAAAILLGSLIGALAGYISGWVDNVVIMFLDTVQAFPAIVLALAFLAIIGPSRGSVIFVIAFGLIPGYARVFRAQVLAIKETPFIEAERSLGAPSLSILLVHIFPNIIPSLIVLAAMDIPGAMIVEAGLSFLGLGVSPPTPSWGVILSEGFNTIRSSPWAVLWGSLTLMLATLGFTFFGEALRDLLDPTISSLRRTL